MSHQPDIAELVAQMRKLGFSRTVINMIVERDERDKALILIDMAQAYLDGNNPFPPEYDFPLPAYIEESIQDALRR